MTEAREGASVELVPAKLFAEHARGYAELGWALVRVAGKRPLGKDWQTTKPGEPEYVAGMWSQWGLTHGMGVVLGTSGLAVIDVDHDDADDVYRARFGELPETPIARTGRGRLQMFFRDSGDLTKTVIDGVELRVGAHQCVVPPSVHPDTGKPYVWERAPWDTPLAELPARVYEYFNAATSNGGGAAAPMPEIIPAGAIDTTLTSLAGSMRHRGADEAAIRAALVATLPRCESGHTHTEKDCARIARSVMRYPAVDPAEDAKVAAYLERAKPTAAGSVARVRLRPLGSYEARAVEMLIPGHVPVGAPTLLSGIGGLGKSTLALGWGAKLSRGELGPAGDTIYVSFEDTAAEVLLPRVQAAGGDPDRIHVVEFADGVDQVSLPRDIDVLRQLIHSVDARLLVVDPIMAALDLRLDSHKDQHVRVVMAQFRTIAEEARCALVSIGHLNKAPTTDGYLRVGGSPAFWNSARSVVLVTADPNDPDVYRLVSQLKANLARLAPIERWRIEDADLGADPVTGRSIRVPRMMFVEVADDVDRDDVLGSQRPTKKESAEAWLAGTLSDGERHDVAALKDAGRTIGYSESTLDRAATELGVEKQKTDTFPSRSQWRLIPHSSATHSSNPHPKVDECVETAQPSGSSGAGDTHSSTDGGLT